MFKFLVNKKSTKQSLKNLSLFLKEKGYFIPHNILLEALAKVFFVKNWNTLKAMSERDIDIPVIKNESKYSIIFKAERDADKILEILKSTLLIKNNFVSYDFYIENIFLVNKTYHIHFATRANFNYWITYLLVIGNTIKKNNIKMEMFEYVREVNKVEKVNILSSLKTLDYDKLNPEIFKRF